MVNNLNGEHLKIEIIDNFIGKGPKRKVRIDFYKNNKWHKGPSYSLVEARERLKEYEEKGWLKYPKYRLVKAEET